MAASHSDRAVVIRLTDYSETSQIVSFFTQRHGQTRVIAKGIKRGTKKRFQTGVDLLELGEVSFVPARGDAGLGTLTSWLQVDTFDGLRRQLPSLYAGLYVAELLSTLTEQADPHAELFQSTLDTLSALARGEAVIERLVAYQRSLLSCIGYLPQMDRCLDCGQPPIVGTPAYFSSAAGGLICRDCEMHHVEKCAVPRSIGDGARGEGDAAWMRLYDYHLRCIAGRAFKTADPLFGILRVG